jgi:hypothetical protein
MQGQYTPSCDAAQAPAPAILTWDPFAGRPRLGAAAAVVVTAILGVLVGVGWGTLPAWMAAAVTAIAASTVVWASREALAPRVRRIARLAGLVGVLLPMLPLAAPAAAAAKGVAVIVAAHAPAAAAAVSPAPQRPDAGPTLPYAGAVPQRQDTPRPAPAARPQAPRAPPVARSGRTLAPAPTPPQPAPSLSTYSRKEYVTMQITIAHHVFQPHEPADARLTYRNCAELGEVDLTVYLVPPEGTRLDGPQARETWITDTCALAKRAGANLCDVLDFCAAYFRDHPNDITMTLSIASYAEWRGTHKIVRLLPDGTKESKGYDKCTIQSFNDALQLLRSLRARMTVTYRPGKGKKPITVTDEGALYQVSPMTLHSRQTGETLATAWRVIPGVLARRLRKIGQYYSLPKAVLALRSPSAKNLMRYIYDMHRISGRAEGVLPWGKAIRVAGVSAATARNATRTRAHIMAALQALTHGDAPALTALRQTPQGIAYTLGPRHPARTPRPAVRRGVRRVVRVVCS